MLRRPALMTGAATLGLALTGPWPRADMPKEFRIGLLGGENTQDRLVRYGDFQKLLPSIFACR
jgi:ABC-type phosphate/phosphonate transport system substrate-binding protein